MNRKLIAVAVAALLAVPMLAQAGERGGFHPRVNAHQAHQHQRIAQGVRQGDLNRHEARRLAAEQRHIHREERRYTADGHLSGRERRDLRRDQHRADRHIYNQRHDGDRRGDGHGFDDRRHGGRHAGPGNAAYDPRRGGHGGQDYNQRISAGLRSGALTPREAQALRGELREVRGEERGYWSDRTLNGAERAELRREHRELASNIRTEMRDGERRR